MLKAKYLVVSFVMLISSSISTSFLNYTNIFAATPGDITVNIDTMEERDSISPYIYGTNQDLPNTKFTARRLGGNRLTAFNWENGYSNAGIDDRSSSDTFLQEEVNVPKSRWTEPGAVATTFHDQSLGSEVPYSIITLQGAGYVSADGNGPVRASEAAPSARWKEVKFTKGAPFSLIPDTNDNYVYMDEFVNFLVNKYGNATSATGIKGYSLDNEPALWQMTHPLMHPQKPTCSELVNKNIELAKAIKAVDPGAEVFGGVMYGFDEYRSFQLASDWGSIEGSYPWFLDYYLDSMKKASDTNGQRLVDVLDLHWYPEARGGGSRVCYDPFDPNNIDCNKARLQAPRGLWDPTYKEDSWIGDECPDGISLIPRIKESIDKYNPGTKLAFTEYSYGGDNHITGGIAQADVLGIYGKYGVHLSTFWALNYYFSGRSDEDYSYVQSAINLYTNYDGNGSEYGDTKVKCEASDIVNSSAYASITGSDDKKLHVIVLNKNYTESVNFNFNINSSSAYSSGRVWGFDSSSAQIKEMQTVSSIRDNKFTYSVPPLTALHIVLEDTHGNDIPTLTPCLYAGSVTANPGEDVTLKLTMKDIVNLAGIKVKLKYDCSKLSIKSIILDSDMSLNALNKKVKGEIYFNGINSDGITKDLLDIATVTFTVNSRIPAKLMPLELPINIACIEACDINAQNISIVCNKGKITVVPPVLPVAENVTYTGECVIGQKLTASYTYSDVKNRPESGTKFRWLAADHGTGNFKEIQGAVNKTITISKEYVGKDIKVEVTPANSEVTGIAATGKSNFNTVILIGDINKDQKVNFIDALLILRSITGKIILDQQQLISANVDGTEGVTINDAVFVLKADMDLISLN